MILTYRFRLYPTSKQEWALEETLETCRHLYNRLLDDRIKNHTGVFAQKRALTGLRRKEKYLSLVHSQVVQDVAFRLDKAFCSFFAGLSRFPRFKRKDRYNSFTYPQLGSFNFVNKRLRLSMIGDVRIRKHLEMVGLTKTCTVVRDIDQWYACIVAEVGGGVPPSNDNPATGVDLGISSIVTLSNGTKIPAPTFLKKSKIEIKTLQKSLSRKRNDSKNKEKARIQLAKAWRRVRNRRNDFAHKTSRFLADNYSLVTFEDLNLKNIVRNHNLASAIMDACWGKLRRLTAYKAERRGGRALLVEPRGTSQKCSRCGNTQTMPLSKRVYACDVCGLVMDRDVNAARNVLAKGLEQARVETEPLPVRRIGKFSQGNKKPTTTDYG